VPGARAGDPTPPLRAWSVRLRRHDVLPVLPVAVPHEHRDRRAERFARAHPGEPLDLVGLDLHAGAPAVPPHAPLQLAVDALGGHGETGGDPLEDRDQAAPVGLARRREPERHVLCPL
jgi:hypothetical protein